MHYQQLSASEKEQGARLTEDLCEITHGEGTDYFVRVVLEIPIQGIVDPFMWGVWVSLSETSFRRYVATWADPDESDSFFGWFSNRLPYYPDTLALRTQVRPRKHGIRPCLELQPAAHPLAIHFHEGITIQEAQRIAEVALHAR